VTRTLEPAEPLDRPAFDLELSRWTTIDPDHERWHGDGSKVTLFESRFRVQAPATITIVNTGPLPFGVMQLSGNPKRGHRFVFVDSGATVRLDPDDDYTSHGRHELVFSPSMTEQPGIRRRSPFGSVCCASIKATA
jgi:hypothetical protein